MHPSTAHDYRLMPSDLIRSLDRLALSDSWLNITGPLLSVLTSQRSEDVIIFLISL